LKEQLRSPSNSISVHGFPPGRDVGKILIVVAEKNV
jgi:hypothetical protein